MPKRLIYERILRFSAPILPLLAQDCGHFAPGLSLLVMEGDRSFPKIPHALNSRREVESSHDRRRCSIAGSRGHWSRRCRSSYRGRTPAPWWRRRGRSLQSRCQQLAEGLQLARMRREASSDVGPIARGMRNDRGARSVGCRAWPIGA
jgi:hypothetical protein